MHISQYVHTMRTFRVSCHCAFISHEWNAELCLWVDLNFNPHQPLRNSTKKFATQHKHCMCIYMQVHVLINRPILYSSVLYTCGLLLAEHNTQKETRNVYTAISHRLYFLPYMVFIQGSFYNNNEHTM